MIYQYVYEKNDFAEVSKNLTTDLKIILLDYQNNYVKRSNCLLHNKKYFVLVLKIILVETFVLNF